MTKQKWKREKVRDHKFEYLDVTEFEKNTFANRIKYSFVFFIVLKSVLVYLADIWTAGALLFIGKWTIRPTIPIDVSKWIFLGSIMLSFLLLYLEIRKSRAIVASNDISYAFTSTISYRYYTLTSFAHWCFFQTINDSQQLQDKFAFFVFFRFKGWKRLLFADGPRQVINAVTLFSVLRMNDFSFNINKYGNITTLFALAVMAFTVLMFFISLLLLGVAFFVYIPILCKIRGNLKEYCCHLIDKRIDLILKKQRLERIKRESLNQGRSGGHQINIQPTLPNLDDDDGDDVYQRRGSDPLNNYVQNTNNINNINKHSSQQMQHLQQLGFNNSTSSSQTNTLHPQLQQQRQQQQHTQYQQQQQHHPHLTSNATTSFHHPTTSTYSSPPLHHFQPQPPPSTSSLPPYIENVHKQQHNSSYTVNMPPPPSTSSLSPYIENVHQQQHNSPYTVNVPPPPLLLSPVSPPVLHNNSNNGQDLPSRYNPQDKRGYKGYNNYTLQGGGRQ